MEERFNNIKNKEYQQTEENHYKRPYIIKRQKKYKISLNNDNENDFDYEDGQDNNIYDHILKNNNVGNGKEDKLKVFNQNFLNLYKNKNDYKVNKINKYFFNNNKYDDDNNNNYKLNKNFKYLSSINPFNTIRKEGPTGHADAIPESITDKLYNSIFQISLYNGMATGFFMRIKLNNIEKKYLLTCFHVISDQDIQNQKTIDIFFGKKGEESHREIELDKNMRFMKAYKEEDVTIIEMIDNDRILKGKYLTLDLNYEYGYERYLNENCYLAGYPENHSERCISSGRIIEIKNYKFYHELDTRPGSSGSPITNDKGDVIGIHTHGLDLLNKNKGTFIGKILDNLKDEYILININNYISGQSTSYNLYNHGNNNSNIKSNYDMIDTNNKIKTSFENYEKNLFKEKYILKKIKLIKK